MSGRIMQVNKLFTIDTLSLGVLKGRHKPTLSPGA